MGSRIGIGEVLAATEAGELRRLTPAQRLTLLVLADLGRRRIYPHVLRRRCGFAEPTLDRCLRELLDRDLVTADPEYQGLSLGSHVWTVTL